MLQHPPLPQPTDVPDPLLPQAWHLPRIGVPRAWTITKGRHAVTLAFVDSGIDYNHPEIAPNLKRNTAEWPPNGQDKDGNGFIDDVIGWDFIKNTWLPWDRNGHGTAAASIAAAVEGNGVGSAGVCPQCSIMATRFLDSDGFGWDENGLAAIHYAERNGAAVINLSFAGEGYDKGYHDALKEALARDIVVVAAAGNDAENIDKGNVYPPKFQDLPNMIVVAAVDKFDVLVRDPDTGRGSNWSKNFVHIAAPGEDLIALWRGGEWELLHGTSFAAPIVTGAVGLLRSANPKLTATEIVQIIMATARHTDSLQDKVMSGGVLDLTRAMSCALTRGIPCLNATDQTDASRRGY
jgi:subtilisin family serine protease